MVAGLYQTDPFQLQHPQCGMIYQIVLSTTHVLQVNTIVDPSHYILQP